MCNSMRFLVLSDLHIVREHAYRNIGRDSVNKKEGNLYLMDAESLGLFKFKNIVTDNNRLVKYII